MAAARAGGTDYSFFLARCVGSASEPSVPIQQLTAVDKVRIDLGVVC
jgi:hypothetical protein